MSSTRLRRRGRPLRRHQQPAAGENVARPANEPLTPPACEGAEAGAGESAAILRRGPARAPCRERRLLSQAAAADEK